MKSSSQFVRVFVDTLNDLKTTQRFGESYGSYPVLRVHDHKGNEIGGRLDGNKVAGKIPKQQVLDQLSDSLKQFPLKEFP